MSFSHSASQARKFAAVLRPSPTPTPHRRATSPGGASAAREAPSVPQSPASPRPSSDASLPPLAGRRRAGPQQQQPLSPVARRPASTMAGGCALDSHCSSRPPREVACGAACATRRGATCVAGPPRGAKKTLAGRTQACPRGIFSCVNAHAAVARPWGRLCTAAQTGAEKQSPVSAGPGLGTACRRGGRSPRRRAMFALVASVANPRPPSKGCRRSLTHGRATGPCDARRGRGTGASCHRRAWRGSATVACGSIDMRRRVPAPRGVHAAWHAR